MKKSKSAPSLHALAKPPLRRVPQSCNALPDLADNAMLFIAKAPITQVYQCTSMQSPPLTDNTIDRSYAICIATPHDPVEDEQVFMNQLKRNNMQYYSLERFQIWYNRLVRGRRSNLSTNNTGAINPADSS